jgi:hypothetical protein
VLDIVVRIFFSRRLDPVLDGGVGDEDAMITPEMPTGRSVRQAIFGNKSDGPLLDAAGVQAVGQSQVGNIGSKATATAEAAMTRESDNHIDGPLRPSIAKVMQGARGDGITTGAVATVRAGSCRPVTAAPLDAWLGQVFDASDALGDIRNILTWTSHGCSPDARDAWSLSYAHRKSR